MNSHNPLGPNQHFVVDDRFQWRYTGYLVLAIFGSVLLVGGPAFYFVNQNYTLFIQLAYQYSPDLLTHLERERLWINSFLVISMIGMVVFCVFFGIRMTSKMITPILSLEKHLEGLVRGDWSKPPIKTNKGDEFEDLLETYNYFYRSYQIRLTKEFELLSKIHIDEKQAEAKDALHELVNERASQLKIESHVVTHKEKFHVA